MTKQELAILKEAAEVLDRLADTDGKNEDLPIHYRNSLIEADDHYSMLMSAIDKNEKTVVMPGFWNFELRRDIESGGFQHDINYAANSYKNEQNNEFELLITKPHSGRGESVVGLYQNYLTDDYVKDDINLLVTMGYKFTGFPVVE